MSFEIGKSFRFESAHRLHHHEGKCSRPHGHSYEFELIVEARDLVLEGSGAGMVTDYDLLSEAGNAIATLLDHRDLNEVFDSDTTTAEELSRLVWEMAKARLPNLVEVRFKETAKTFASYRPQRAEARRIKVLGEMLFEELKVRLYDGVDTTDPRACWIFSGGRDEGGYGYFKSVWANTTKAHRVAAWLAGDDIEGRTVLHSCDNPPCINPAHLYAGTHAENEADTDAKGRRPIGEAHGAAKLTEAKVRGIVADVERGVSRRRVAQALGISTSLVNAIMTGRVWRHVTKKERPSHG